MERQKAWMTAKEELFIISLLCSNVPLSPKSTALVRCVAALLPRRCRLLEKKKNSDIFIKKLQAKTIGGNQASISGEDSVNNLVLNLLKRKIQTHHFNIVQIAFNMGKLAGMQIIIGYCTIIVACNVCCLIDAGIIWMQTETFCFHICDVNRYSPSTHYCT